MFDFPDPNTALSDPNGLLAIGGDLSPETLIAAYERGIFPWFSEGEPIMWWSPDPRLVLFFADFHLSSSFQKTLKKQNYTVTCDKAFEQVIHQCAHIPSRLNQTWITQSMIQAYVRLHELGLAHSIEVWESAPEISPLIGGLYGVSLGQTFFGESMFSLKKDTSKIALHFLVRFLKEQGLTWIDCQVPSEHLMRLGATTLPRGEFLKLLKDTLSQSSKNISWSTDL